MAQQTTPLTSAVAHADATLSDMGDSLTRLADGQQQFGERIKAQESASIEIETQFRALDNTANLMRATELRLMGLLWEKVYGQKMPEFFFAPSISRGPA